jgi:nicotinamidase-related amidase
MNNIIQDVDSFMKSIYPFFEYVKEWSDNLPQAEISQIIEEAGGPEKVAVVGVDLIEGFCRIGTLASPRVRNIIEPVVEIFKKAHELGVRDFILPQDTHSPDTPEFKAFPPHCIAGSEESETVKEIKDLPFFNEMKIIRKNSINSGIGVELREFLAKMNVKRIIVVGDCTDLCTYQLAMYLRLLANDRGYDWEVIVPINAIDTYDLPVEIARSIEAPAHPGDFFHVVFLYHMHLNGIKCVSHL